MSGVSVGRGRCDEVLSVPFFPLSLPSPGPGPRGSPRRVPLPVTVPRRSLSPPRAGGAGVGMAAWAHWARVARVRRDLSKPRQRRAQPGGGGGSRLSVHGRGRSPSRDTAGRRCTLSPAVPGLTSAPGTGRAPGRAAGSGTRLRRRLPGPLGLRPQAGGQHGHVRGGGGHRAAGAAPSLQVSTVHGQPGFWHCPSAVSCPPESRRACTHTCAPHLTPVSDRPSELFSVHPSIHLLPVSHRSLYPWSLAAAPAPSPGPIRPHIPAARRSGAGGTRPALHARKIAPGPQVPGRALPQCPALPGAACTRHHCCPK